MAKPSVAIFTHSMTDGAFANIPAALARGLCEEGVADVWIVYLSAGPGSYVQLPDRVKLVSLNVRRSRWAPLPLSRFLTRERPDVLISVGSNLPAVLGCLLAGSRAPMLVLNEQATVSYKTHVEHRDFRHRMQFRCAPLLYPRAQGLVATSRPVLDDLRFNLSVRMPDPNMAVISNPVDLAAVRRFAQEDPLHPWLREKDKPVILCAARLARQKNIPLLLKAFSQIRQTHDAELIVAGEGPDRPLVEQMVAKEGLAEHVSLPGLVANPWAAMARADVFALSSEEEGFGLVLVEAMACGLPVVTTDAIGGGPRSIVGDGEHGLIVPNRDADALARGIFDLLSDPAKAKFYADAGLRRCEAFAPRTIARTWLEFIQRLVQEGRRPEVGESRFAAAATAY